MAVARSGMRSFVCVPDTGLIINNIFSFSSIPYIDITFFKDTSYLIIYQNNFYFRLVSLYLHEEKRFANGASCTRLPHGLIKFLTVWTSLLKIRLYATYS